MVGTCCRGSLLETGSQGPVATAPDLTVKTEVQDRIAKSLLLQYVLGFWGPFKPRLHALQASENKHGSAKHILRQCRSLSSAVISRNFLNCAMCNAGISRNFVRCASLITNAVFSKKFVRCTLKGAVISSNCAQCP